MSNRPDKCRWCGCTEIIRDGFPEIHGGREVLFACRSVWYETALGWLGDPEQCDGQCQERVVSLHESYQDAIDAGMRLQGNNPEIPEGLP